MLKIGDTCPTFTLVNQENKKINLADFIGKKILVVYFYPKDNTPGCTKEACSFRDRYEDFKDLGCEVFGISSDDAKSHQTFSTQYNLPFSLLSDPDQKVRKAFEVPTNLFGLLPGRVTYIIDLKGKIQGIYNSQTQPVKHITQALDKVKSMIA